MPFVVESVGVHRQGCGAVNRLGETAAEIGHIGRVQSGSWFAPVSRCTCCPHVQILGLLHGLTQKENTGGATLNTCCLNARVSWAQEARWQLSFSGMTSSGRVLDLIMHRRCCLQRFLLIVPLLWLLWLAWSRSSSTLLLHWDVPPLGT